MFLHSFPVFLLVLVLTTNSLVSTSDEDELYELLVKIFKEQEETTIELDKMQERVDHESDPCQDFYQYACGDFNKVEPIEKGKAMHGTVHKMADKMYENIHLLLYDNSTEIKAYKDLEIKDKTKLLYNSCYKANIFDFRKSPEYLDLIESIGNIPVLSSDWKEETFNFTKAVATLKLHKVSVFLEESIRGPYLVVTKSTDFGLIDIEDKDFGVPWCKDYRMNIRLISYILELYGVDEMDAKTTAREIMEFWNQFLINASKIPVHKPRYKSIKYFDKNLPRNSIFNFYQYFSILFGEEIRSDMKIYLSDFNYFKEFPQLFQQSDMKTIANYMFVKLLFHLHDELTEIRYDKRFCVRKAQKYLTPVPNLIYIKSSYYDDSGEDVAASMIDDMREAFNQTINAANWLDDKTKQKALEKLNAMKISIGDKTNQSNFDVFDIYYKGYEVTDNYHQNNLNLRRFEVRQLHKFYLHHNETVSVNIDLGVNAFYSPTKNEIVMPPGILQRPMFFVGMPAAYNFGVMGANIIGHEMIHGFDSIGRHYNSEGVKENWWTEQSDREYENRSRCFVEQYNNYKIIELNEFVNGQKTLAENIADNGGLRLGYLAYKNWKERNGDDDGLVEVENHDELFFVSFGQASCSELKRKGLKMIAGDLHTADKFRVIGPVSNFEPFAKTFNCSLGSPMNPVKKCALW